MSHRECLVSRTELLRNDGYTCEEIGPSNAVHAALEQDTQYIGSDADSCERLLRKMQACDDDKRFIWLSLNTVAACEEVLLWDALVHIDGLLSPLLNRSGLSVVITASTVRTRVAYQPNSFMCVHPACGMVQCTPPPLGNLTHCLWNVVSVLCGVPMDLPQHADRAVTRCIDTSKLCHDPSTHASRASSLWVRSLQPRPDRHNDFSVVVRFSVGSLASSTDLAEPVLFAEVAAAPRTIRAHSVEVYDLCEDRDEEHDIHAGLCSNMRRAVDEVVRYILSEPVVGIRTDDWLNKDRAPLCVIEQLPYDVPPICTVLLPLQRRADPGSMPVVAGVITDATRSVDMLSPRRGSSAALRYEGGTQCMTGWRLTSTRRHTTSGASSIHVILVERDEVRGAQPRAVQERRRPR